MYTAIPIGMLGNAFGKVWEDRERLLLLQQLRRRVMRAGFTPDDLAKLFECLDQDGNSQLTFDEFKVGLWGGCGLSADLPTPHRF